MAMLNNQRVDHVIYMKFFLFYDFESEFDRTCPYIEDGIFIDYVPIKNCGFSIGYVSLLECKSHSNAIKCQ